MEKEIYDYLMEAMYPLPCCDSCRYSDVDVKRVPCNRCDGWDKWKFHPGHREDLKRMARGIMKIVKRQSFDNKKKKTMKESDKVIGEIRQELGSREVNESGLQVKESGSMEVKESGLMEVKESGLRRVKKLQSWRGLIEAGDELCCGAAQKEGFRICADYLIGRLMKMPVDMAVLQVMEWNATREDMNATREEMG